MLFVILAGDTEPLGSVVSTTFPASSNVVSYPTPPRHTIDQLALNMGFGGIRPNISNQASLSTATTSSTASLINSADLVFQPVITPSNSEQKFEFNDNISSNTEFSIDTETEMKERVITKVDPIDMTAKPTVVTVPKDPARRTAVLLSGPKFQLNSNIIPKEKLEINTDIIYSVAVSLIII